MASPYTPALNSPTTYALNNSVTNTVFTLPAGTETVLVYPLVADAAQRLRGH